MDTKFGKILNEYKSDPNLIKYFDNIIDQINKHKQFIKICNDYIENKPQNIKLELITLLDQIDVDYGGNYTIFTLKHINFGKNKDDFYFGDMIKTINGNNTFNVQILKNFYKILNLKNITIYIFLDFVSVITKINIQLDIEFYKAELSESKYGTNKKNIKNINVSGFNNSLKFNNQKTTIQFL